MITVSWHLILLISIIVIGLIIAITRDNSDGYGPSSRDIAMITWFILSVIGIIIYGGIFWW